MAKTITITHLVLIENILESISWFVKKTKPAVDEFHQFCTRAALYEHRWAQNRHQLRLIQLCGDVSWDTEARAKKIDFPKKLQSVNESFVLWERDSSVCRTWAPNLCISFWFRKANYFYLSKSRTAFSLIKEISSLHTSCVVFVHSIKIYVF